ncbi:efflux RND transporter periplasmic adaptor subunit [Marinicella marina]|uniref:efflux RND transporter periplasmic adaptor subunit n=1 Tax=Marinicella marina TaxID=2996016 RepID=UPI0024BC8409|nr:efflux RND transporter periplasmic adaptor subunit [Marinicella marina]MDJ1140028.1 efflux RND transporter periplasmic adaptor subunit [Marinicella marina]
MKTKNIQAQNNLILGLLLGLILGGLLTYFIYATENEAKGAEKNSEQKEPLYWVAPMDPNYRRDQPGQSPMGMDLIPYYGDEGNDSPGTINISPDVVNNLGVRTEEVTSRKGSSVINGVGVVQYNEEQLFHIHPRVEGWIEKLHIKSSGVEVSKKQPLYDMYSPQLVNAQEELILALKRNDSQFIKASEERLKSLQFSNEQIAAVKKSKKALQQVTFYSPNHGVVENLKIREGFYVKPGDTLMSIGALDEVWVEVDILEKQASLISLNQAVKMKLDYAPGKTWDGFVDFIHPTLDAMTRTLKVRLRFQNSDKALKPNMYASITIDAVAENSTLVVPAEAVIRTGNSNRVVLVLGNGMFKSVDVALGYLYDDYIEVLDGLVLGDVVVTSAQFLLDSESSKTSDLKRMDHSQMDHSQMDHSQMDHSQMDHSQMDHFQMDHSKGKNDEEDEEGQR